MQPDSHPGPTESHDLASGAHPVSASSRSWPLRSSLVAWVGVFGLAALPLVGCGDEDSTGLIARGGSGGASGSAGTAGTAGNAGRGGNGGSSGSAGNAGAAGMGGIGGNSFDGPAVAAAICATMGQLAGTGADPDAGADGGAPDAGDAGPAATGCSASPTCADELAGFFGFIESDIPACADETQVYFTCMSTQPVSAYRCEPTTNVPIISEGAHGCVASENEYLNGFVDPSTCE